MRPRSCHRWLDAQSRPPRLAHLGFEQIALQLDQHLARCTMSFGST
jgi:hypothetical protein